MRTVKAVFGDSDKLRARVKYDSEWQEYRVVFYDYYGDRLPDADYHTDDRDDAIVTANTEVMRMDARERLTLAQAANP